MADASEPLHPIADRAAHLIAKNGDAPFLLDAASADAIERDLQTLYGKDELRRAVADLIRLACYFDTERASPDVAQSLLRVVETTVDALRALDDRETEMPEGADAAKKLVGAAETAKAPKVGEAAPRGSVKLGSLDYPKRG